MPERQLLRPDGAFIDAVLASGGGDLKKCFQCATCSVACQLSTGGTPFPRKEMHWVQWGLKERLVSDPDVWTCFQCNDCSSRCPRQARPGDVLAAVRQQVIRHYAVPQAFARWVNGYSTLPLMLAGAAVLLAVALLARDPLAAALGMEAPREFYARMMPHWLLIGFFSFFVGLALLGAGFGIARFWKAMGRADAAAGRVATAAAGVIPSIGRTLRTILLHDRFGQCTARSSRRWTHLLAFYGFLALLAVTIYAVLDLYLWPALGIPSAYPFSLLHPAKLVANAGALLLVVGATKAILDRRSNPEASTAFDWWFAWLLLAVGLTGVMVEVLRFAMPAAAGEGIRTTAYGLYFVHLVLVFGLLVYLPYSKFAHLLYRTVALIYAERTGRTRETRSAEVTVG